jgi:uncharacterized protein YprB with RNaseH-like and TPR domain
MKYGIVKLASGEYRVQTPDGNIYLVDLVKGVCTCPGFKTYRRCKHIPMVEGYRIAKEGEATPLKETLLLEMSFQRVEEERDYITCYDRLGCSINNGCILDIETTGVDPAKDEIITLGFIKGDELCVVQRRGLATEPFYSLIGKVLHSLPQPIFAYNSKFEESFLKTQLGFQGQFVDLMEPWRVKAEDVEVKYPTLDELVPGPEAYMGERRITGSEVVLLWRRYREDRDERKLALIIRHNQIDLLQSMAVLIMTSLIR